MPCIECGKPNAVTISGMVSLRCVECNMKLGMPRKAFKKPAEGKA